MVGRVLVTGASIAGPAIAWWLGRAGWDVEVVERAPSIRTGGQTIDLRGVGRMVMDRMGLVEAARARTTQEKGISFVDEYNHTFARFAAKQFGGEGPVAEIELLRGELVRVLVDASCDIADYRFNDTIDNLTQDGQRVHVQFASGRIDAYDLVIVAEGIGSATRNLLWGAEVKRRSLNLATAYFTIPHGPSDTADWRWFNAPGGRGVLVRPDNQGTTRAALNLLNPPRDLERRPQAEQKGFLRQRFADAGWETARVLDGMDAADDFYLEAIGQVRLDHWNTGRVVLVGDAAYCPSPLSGMGTTLALAGAYVLAGELNRHDNLEIAFAEYDRFVRPFVDQVQKIPGFVPRIGQPVTRIELTAQRSFLKLAASPLASRLAGNLLKTPSNDMDLPDYGVPSGLGHQREAVSA